MNPVSSASDSNGNFYTFPNKTNVWIYEGQKNDISIKTRNVETQKTASSSQTIYF